VALKIAESSTPAVPSTEKSVFELAGLFASTEAQVAQDGHVIVPGASGAVLRKYPADTKSVKITTGGSTGNDIDLTVLECAATATTADDASCAVASISGGPTDVESVTLSPKADKAYAVRVDGYDIKANDGKFTSTETITTTAESGTVAVSGSGADFSIAYSLSTEQVAASHLLQSELFTGGKYSIVGSLKIRAADGTTIAVVPVKLSR
jgi:hypothetical protein